MRIEFEIPGIPKAKGRPRFARMGNFTKTYTPKETIINENYIKLASMQYRPPKPFESPLSIKIVFHLPRPKSLPKKVKYHTKKPDLDNLCKSVLDALEGTFFLHDQSIMDIRLSKFYAIKEPKTEITIEEIE